MSEAESMTAPAGAGAGAGIPGTGARAVARVEWIALAAILAVGAFLRLRHLGDVPFGQDAAHMLEMSDRLRAGERVLTGIPSSKGLLNPPLSIYMLGLMRLVFPTPRALVAATAVWNLSAVAGTWALARRWFSPRVALLAAALFAVSGWAVTYSRGIWQQDFIAPLGVLALAGLLAWALERRTWGLALALALAAAVSQLHMTGFAWFTVVAAVWIALRPPLTRGSIAAGLGISALLYAPFAIAAVTTGLGGGGKGPQALFVDFLGTPVKHALGSVTHGGITFDLPTMHAAFARLGGAIGAMHPLFDLVPWIGAAFAIAGFLACLPPRGSVVRTTGPIPFRLAESTEAVRSARVVLALWIAVPLAEMVGSGLSTAPHYVILLFPAMWILAALGAEALAERFPRVRAPVWGTAVAVVAIEAAFVVAMQQWIAFDFTRPGGFGPALRFQEAAIGFVAADAGSSAVEIVPVPDPVEPGAPRAVGDNFRWLLREARGAERGAAPARRYVLIDLADGALSKEAQAAIEKHQAQRFGPLWVVPW